MRSSFLVAPLALAACHSDSDSNPAPAPQSLVLNLGLAGKRVIGTGDLRLVLGSEEDQGVDLDGDGDTTDVVMQVLKLGANVAFWNTGLALPHGAARDEVPPPESASNDTLGAFQVSEAETGRDLDEDGTADDVATWVLGRTGLVRLPFAHAAVLLGDDFAAFLAEDEAGSGRLALRVFDNRDGSLSQPALGAAGLVAARGRVVAFLVAELGALDLNADGDTTDSGVLHVYDADLRRVVNTGFDVTGEVRLAGGFVGFDAFENGHDLDGDGNDAGFVFVAVDVHSGLTRVPGLGQALFGDFLRPDPERFLLVVHERGTDQNGDGDGDDDVALLYDPRSDRITETGLATAPSMVSDERWVGVSVFESEQGEQDLDGNGDSAGLVLHVFDSRTGRHQNLGLSGGWLGVAGDQLLGVHFEFDGPSFVNELVVWDARNPVGRRTGIDARNVLGSSGTRALMSVREHDEDLNGDGDVEDFVLALYDARTGTVRSLGLATSVFQGSLAPVGQAGVLVSEPAQGADLNGDGDQLDQVLYQVYVDGPQG